MRRRRKGRWKSRRRRRKRKRKKKEQPQHEVVCNDKFYNLYDVNRYMVVHPTVVVVVIDSSIRTLGRVRRDDDRLSRTVW